ncbi:MULTISPECIES: 3'-5' exonuclease [Symbiopectobacterium]|uniref:3'-5' exonuclease n=1 Tax=Symbiopectobacterium TaxID=801 RepID=UPI001A1E9185|nr:MULTISPECIES: 3'-5' exonuclease [Symbiopectobacterium]MBG6248355.1 3'-5' exoribonuclease [Candidatus Symbiopectobacterium sp. PLON1]MBT9430266.1 3'-5' exoribonuclease [Candidatus Symbiopectobacterium endolongispinus]
MNHLMIDLETMGNNTQAPIVSIGAVFFDPATSQLGEKFYSPVSLKSAMHGGGIPDAETILWWMEQSEEARKAICVKGFPLIVVLHDLKRFVVSNCDPKYVRVWGNGAGFDNVILRESCKREYFEDIWQWFNDRDVRTIVELGREIGFDPKKEMPFEGERHNALADAEHQAKYVSAIWQRLFAPHQHQ